MTSLKHKTIMLTVILSCIFIIASGQSVLEKLSNTKWEGKGMLMNTDASFKMHWKSTLDDAFVQLTFQNKRMLKNGKEIIFKANAYYKVVNDSVIKGTWFDSRGITFPLKGTTNATQMTIIWGTPETEQGKTSYEFIQNGQLKVKDYILREDKYLGFGEAVYKSIK
ncbi:hypothetical protein GTQ40_12950 [Flavobacteriaceae bacterium R38]|nr:hypothetical protein [Flavobacteriaceae bacterium R38]